MSTRSRTPPCRKISANGCKFWEKCRFTHNTEQVEKTSLLKSLESSATSVQLGKRNMTLCNGMADTGNVPCRFFKAGHCTEGEGCHWSHVLEDAQGQGTSSNNTNGAWNSSDNNDPWSDERNTGEMRVRSKQGEQRGTELEVERRSHQAQLLAERKMKQMKIAEREASVTLRHVVMDGSMLVICGAGLDIQHLVCGFDSSFVTIKNLPHHVKRHEIEELITEQGVDTAFFCIVQMRYDNDGVEAKVSDSGYGQVIAADLEQQQFDRLVEMAIITYIENQPTKFRCCTTPDCPQIYRCEGSGMVLTCPSCFARVCSGCHKEAHEGMTCRDREIMTNPKEQERLNEEWALASGAKRCPSCRVWIQKAEGCNHMTCQCGVHLCWLCLRTFPEGKNVYTHMNSVHGGIHGDGIRLVQIDEGLDQQMQAHVAGVFRRVLRVRERTDRKLARPDVLRNEEDQQRQRGAEPDREPEWLGILRDFEDRQRQRRTDHGGRTDGEPEWLGILRDFEDKRAEQARKRRAERKTRARPSREERGRTDRCGD